MRLPLQQAFHYCHFCEWEQCIRALSWRASEEGQGIAFSCCGMTAMLSGFPACAHNSICVFRRTETFPELCCLQCRQLRELMTPNFHHNCGTTTQLEMEVPRGNIHFLFFRYKLTTQYVACSFTNLIISDVQLPSNRLHLPSKTKGVNSKEV